MSHAQLTLRSQKIMFQHASLVYFLLFLLVAVLSHTYYPVYHSSGLSLLLCPQPRLGRAAASGLLERVVQTGSVTANLSVRLLVCLFIFSSFLA